MSCLFLFFKCCDMHVRVKYFPFLYTSFYISTAYKVCQAMFIIGLYYNYSVENFNSIECPLPPPPPLSPPSPPPPMITYLSNNLACLTLCLLVSSADNLCKLFGPDQVRQNVGPELDPNCSTLLRYS